PPILVRPLDLPVGRARVKELELDRLLDARLVGPDGLRGTRGQHRDPRLRKMPLEAPHGGKGNDAGADMVELDDEDLAYAVSVNERPAGNRKLRRLMLHGKVVVVLRQAGVKKRVAADKDMPPFALEHRGVELVVEGGAADH